jgi:protoporphyrinogen oxidase
MPRTLYILGAGPAGLGAAYTASKLKIFERIVVVETNERVGGLAQTINWEGSGKHDLGPHKLFTLDAGLFEEIKSFLPKESWLIRNKIAKVYQAGRIMNYPPSILDMVKHFNFRLPLVVIEFLAAKARPKKTRKNLQEALISLVGKSLANEIILPAVRKVWGDPLSLNASLAKSRIQIPTLREIILGLFKKNAVDNLFEARIFHYPKGGLSVLWESIQTQCKENGVSFELSTAVTDLKVIDKKIVGIKLDSGKKYTIDQSDLVINTLNQDKFLSLAELSSNRSKSTMDLILVFLQISEKMNKVSWYFVADSRLRSHRISSQSSFDPEMVESGDIICLEFMDQDGSLSNEMALNLAEGEFRSIYGQEVQIIAKRVIRLKDSYPRFTDEDLTTNVKNTEILESISNLLSVGRHGAGQYVGSLDAFDMGRKALIWLNNPTIESKLEYRKNTATYPILD